MGSEEEVYLTSRPSNAVAKTSRVFVWPSNTSLLHSQSLDQNDGIVSEFVGPSITPRKSLIRFAATRTEYEAHNIHPYH